MLIIKGLIKYSMKQISFNNTRIRFPKLIIGNSHTPYSRLKYTTAGEVVDVINV